MDVWRSVIASLWILRFRAKNLTLDEVPPSAVAVDEVLKSNHSRCIVIALFSPSLLQLPFNLKIKGITSLSLYGEHRLVYVVSLEKRMKALYRMSRIQSRRRFKIVVQPSSLMLSSNQLEVPRKKIVFRSIPAIFGALPWSFRKSLSKRMQQQKWIVCWCSCDKLNT